MEERTTRKIKENCRTNTNNRKGIQRIGKESSGRKIL